jgi:integrase/recombinase XerC
MTGEQLEITMMTQPRKPTAVNLPLHPELMRLQLAAPQLIAGVVLPTSPLLSYLEGFLRSLEGRNCSPATRRAYATDLAQLVSWLWTTFAPDILPAEIQRADLEDYLYTLARSGLTGMTRARKLAAIRAFFRHLKSHDVVSSSPAEDLEIPKKERKQQVWLHADEYAEMVNQAADNPRDRAILQVFLQTGVRISELCDLTLEDLDTTSKTLHVQHGKGMVARAIPLEKKVLTALATWLKLRPDVLDEHLFLNRYGEPISQRGVRKLVTKYREAAGITKKATPHSFRRTFADHKARGGVPLPDLMDWMGHKKLSTTQGYINPNAVNKRKLMEATSL